jgi:hypothetical protein
MYSKLEYIYFPSALFAIFFAPIWSHVVADTNPFSHPYRNSAWCSKNTCVIINCTLKCEILTHICGTEMEETT